MPVLDELPDRDLAQIVHLLGVSSKAALRASCKAHKAIVDEHLQRAGYYGVGRSKQMAALPRGIREANVHALGPPTKEWLCRSLAGLHSLTKLTISADPMREDDLRSKRAPPGSIGPIELLSHLSSTCLSELHIHDLGCNVRYTREKQWKEILPPPEKVAAMAGSLQGLTLSAEFRMYNNIFQRLIAPLTQLRSLDLGFTHFGFLPPYATHQLSRMTNLTSLNLNFCQAVLSSHVAPLHTISSLKSLDLRDIQFSESSTEFMDLDPLLHTERMCVLDKDTQDFLFKLRQQTGYGPQVPAGMGPLARPLTFRTPRHPALFVQEQLGRCTGLERLCVVGLQLPEVEEDAGDDPSITDALGPETLAHLTNLKSLELSIISSNTAVHIARLTNLEVLHAEMVDEVADNEAQPMALDELLEALAHRLPQLKSLRLQELDVVSSPGLQILQRLYAITELDLGHTYPPPSDEYAELTYGALPAILSTDVIRESTAPKLQKLSIAGWDLPQASMLCAATSLTELDVSSTQSPNGMPELLWLNWPPELFSHLSHLKRLTCMHTSFGDEQFIRLLTCSPSIQVLRAKGCRISERGVLRASHPGTARESVLEFSRRLTELRQQRPEQHAVYMQHQQGLPALAQLSDQSGGGTGSGQGAGEGVGSHIRAPIRELDLSSQVLDSDIGGPQTGDQQVGDAAALALAACLPDLRSLSLRESSVGRIGFLALASLSHLMSLDLRRSKVAGAELRALSSGSPGPGAHADAHVCILSLERGFIQPDTDMCDSVSEDRQRTEHREEGGAGAAKDQHSVDSVQHGGQGAAAQVSKAWLAQLRQCVDRPGSGQPMFPDLAKLLVTDDRSDPKQVVLAPDVDALANAVERGTCLLRELHVDRGGHRDATPTESDSENMIEGGGEEEGGDASSSEWASASGDDAQGGSGAQQPAGHGQGGGNVQGGGGPVAQGSSGSDSEGSKESEWEEMVWGEDEQLDELARAKVEVQKLPPLLQPANCARWLESGLLVVSAPDLHDDEEFEDSGPPDEPAWIG